MWTYFIFTSPLEGVVENHAINSKRIYRAKLEVKWYSDRIEIVQLGDAVASDGDSLNKDDYTCRPDKSRLLEALVHRGNVKRYKFQLEKIN